MASELKRVRIDGRAQEVDDGPWVRYADLVALTGSDDPARWIEESKRVREAAKAIVDWKLVDEVSDNEAAQDVIRLRRALRGEG